MSSANRDSLLIKDGADVVRMNAFHDEGERADLLLRGSDQPDPGNFFELASGIAQQFVLVLSAPVPGLLPSGLAC